MMSNKTVNFHSNQFTINYQFFRKNIVKINSLNEFFLEEELILNRNFNLYFKFSAE